MSKKITKDEVDNWLKDNAPHLVLLDWSGSATTKSKFCDSNRGVEFEYNFSNLKKELSRNPNILFGAKKEEKKRKMRETCIKKYGVDHPWKNKEIRNKIKNTNIEKYGVDHPWKNEKIREKRKETMLKRYGTEHPLQNEIINSKAVETNLERYGVKYTQQNKEIKEKSKKTNLKRYGFKNPYKNEKVKQKAKQTNLERYGVDHFSKSDQFKEKVLKTRKKRGTITIVDGKTLKEWSKDESLASYTTLLVAFSRGLHPKETKGGITSIQKKILKDINDQGYIEEVDFYHNKVLTEHKGRNKKEVYLIPDFQIPEEKLIIEVNGDYWHCNPKMYEPDYFHPHKKMYAYEIWEEDEEKLKEYEKNGYEVLVLWESDIKKGFKI